jgi:RNA polymerase sigma factor (sigma-70 family)
LDSFIEGAQNDRFPNLRDRDGLWRLLSEMTRRKAIDYLRRGRRQKRGGGKVLGDSAFTNPESSQNGIGQVPGDDPTPEFAIILAEACEILLDQLDTELQQIALNKLEGYTNKEIASKLSCSVATVERRLKLIRKKWQRELT